jgi:hypothetical protein
MNDKAPNIDTDEIRIGGHSTLDELVAWVEAMGAPLWLFLVPGAEGMAAGHDGRRLAKLVNDYLAAHEKHRWIIEEAAAAFAAGNRGATETEAKS